MTSTIINFIVERYLANILEIDTSQTAASLWSGTVEMSNLKIKQEIFENLNLPYLELVNGYVGKLSLKMSMPRFYLYPIKVYVDKVFFHARQKNIDKLNQYEEIKGMESYKLSKLLNAEQLSDEVNQLKNESPGMVQQIINNLQIDIGEIIFRFDDAVSYPKVPFSLGIMLKRMVIQPTTDKFELSKIYTKFFPEVLPTALPTALPTFCPFVSELTKISLFSITLIKSSLRISLLFQCLPKLIFGSTKNLAYFSL